MGTVPRLDSRLQFLCICRKTIELMEERAFFDPVDLKRLSSQFDPLLADLEVAHRPIDLGEQLHLYWPDGMRTSHYYFSTVHGLIRPFYLEKFLGTDTAKLCLERWQRELAPQSTELTADDKGISLYDIAFAIEEDEFVAKQRVKQWIDGKLIQAKPIGKCPIDGRRRLYRLSELLSDVNKILSLTQKEKAKYRQVLTAHLRSPRSD